MNEKSTTGYDEEVELTKGADLTAVSYDATQRAFVTSGKVTVGGKAVTAEISGIASSKGTDGTINLWLSLFRFKKPDGTTKQVDGLNIPTTLKPGQGAINTAKALASYINTSKRPYRATAKGSRTNATITIKFTQN
jgi:hypothetical protein